MAKLHLNLKAENCNMDLDIHPADTALFVAAALRGYLLADAPGGGYRVTGRAGELVGEFQTFKEVANLCGATGHITLRQAAERDGLAWPTSPEAFLATVKNL